VVLRYICHNFGAIFADSDEIMRLDKSLIVEIVKAKAKTEANF
jgi:hypothetical protein